MKLKESRFKNGSEARRRNLFEVMFRLLAESSALISETVTKSRLKSYRGDDAEQRLGAVPACQLKMIWVLELVGVSY